MAKYNQNCIITVDNMSNKSSSKLKAEVIMVYLPFVRQKTRG